MRRHRYRYTQRAAQPWLKATLTVLAIRSAGLLVLLALGIMLAYATASGN